MNLRPPYYNPERIKELLQHADITKMNHQELEEIADWFGWAGNQQEQMQALKQHFGLQLLLVTRGEKGAAALTEAGYQEHEGYQVEVKDTIGSGDAFLATFLKNYLQQEPVQKALASACLMGAYVATQKGATPQINLSKFEDPPPALL